MTWVRFHEELCETEKAGIPRATRFVYMELSLRARPRRGHIVLPQGMPDVKAVQLMLSGNPKEVAVAVETLSAGPDPMIRFGDVEGKRVLVVVSWEKWNPTRDDSRDRVKRWRGQRAGVHELPPSSVGNALHGVTETPETSDGDPLLRDSQEVLARPRALISPLGSEGLSLPSELDPIGSYGSTGSAQSRRPDIVNKTADGAFGMAVDAWAEGIGSVTGKPFTVPRGAELGKLIDAFSAHATPGVDRVVWAREAGAAYAKARAGELFNVHRFADWLNSDRAPRGPAKAAHIQRPAEGESAWTVGK